MYNQKMNYKYYYKTNIGLIGIAEKSDVISHVVFGLNKIPSDYIEEETETIKYCFNEINEYFSGKRKEFSVKINAEGTEFQKKVWNALLEIPYGKTVSYKDIAISIGNPKASRAIGMANNKNPIGIIIPCHRVIGSSGNLVGYAGGLEIKRELLNIEHKKIE